MDQGQQPERIAPTTYDWKLPPKYENLKQNGTIWGTSDVQKDFGTQIATPKNIRFEVSIHLHKSTVKVGWASYLDRGLENLIHDESPCSPHGWWQQVAVKRRRQGTKRVGFCQASCTMLKGTTWKLVGNCCLFFFWLSQQMSPCANVSFFPPGCWSALESWSL